MRIVITAGGTGGHIYPALSFAEAAKDLLANTEILFIGTANHMEANIVPAYGYRFATIEALGLSGSVQRKLKAISTMFGSKKDAKQLLIDFHADVVVGFGGYVSAPVVIAAHSLHIPVLLHEQNSYAGRANLFLERYASAVVTCYQACEKQFKKPVYRYGNPRTYTVMKTEQKQDVRAEYKLNKEMPTVLFVMGSQGSESVNQAMKEVLMLLADKPYQILYVTGKNHYERFINNTSFAQNIHVIPFVDQVNMLRATDLIVTRGGATTASEIGVIGVASIIIPSPYVPNNHQELNAMALVNDGGAVLLKEAELNANKLYELIDELMNNTWKREQMAIAAKKSGYPHAAQDMIELMKQLVHHE